MKVTEAIVAEHATLLRVFAEMERVLPRLSSVAEVSSMAAVAEGLLTTHAELETDLAFKALDHALHHRGRLKKMAQEHQEMDQRLKQVHQAETCAGARRLFRAALDASREHFRNEERSVLAAVEQALEPESSTALGKRYIETRYSGA